MDSVGAYEAKTHLLRLLERVARGERIVITKRGVPVATLQPVNPAATQPAGEIIAALKAFSRGRRLEGVTVREMIEEGRR
ncbi:MAG TPA: type II toxin-antitoxin system prevent-host-death family antitoxin [Candidatus Hydrogenedentes bacterium]|nr:type II toxin-antitoxin system prevent-host-death family antitoxin [Candidatus Hydrogenedentota bacterium]HOC71515.1 type II toxin-antitoxin system prevent-host-death family antitoxin [Candidatus Hydrogenedentota bacterium]HOH50194.1 type II toxin-antitoxin system prevent-host-death family antitoxin [Candidatus Hydrogenedentota bacterium]HQL94569.1 type II toxin-antitoxin system prevent-host-death family antitoxin [Candidatus Hydrogenedentota bacterium]HRZ81372.1 type II toxin-antitoxin syst